MKIALISMTKELDGSGGPVGLAPMLSRCVAAEQARFAIEAGVQKVVFFSHAISGGLVKLVDELRGQGIAADISRSRDDLVVMIAPQDALMLVDDGVLCDSKKLAEYDENGRFWVQVLDDAPQRETLERIDLQHRWAGTALVSGESVAQLDALPEDWDPLSALLRLAIQNNVPRVGLSASDLESGRWRQLQSMADVKYAELALLSERTRQNGGFFSQWILAPLIQRILPMLWHREGAAFGLAIGAGLVPVLAMISAYAKFPAVTCLLVLFGSIVMGLGTGLRRTRLDPQQGNVLASLPYAGFALALGIATIAASVPLAILPNLVILAMSAALAIYLSKRSAREIGFAPYAEWPLLILIVLIFALCGQFIWGIYAAALVSAAALFNPLFRAEKSAEVLENG